MIFIPLFANRFRSKATMRDELNEEFKNNYQRPAKTIVFGADVYANLLGNFTLGNFNRN